MAQGVLRRQAARSPLAAPGFTFTGGTASSRSPGICLAPTTAAQDTSIVMPTSPVEPGHRELGRAG